MIIVLDTEKKKLVTLEDYDIKDICLLDKKDKKQKDDKPVKIEKIGDVIKDITDRSNNSAISKMNLMKEYIRKNSSMDDYETDSMWMSYRYCIGRHTIASHYRVRDIAVHCYGRTNNSVFNAYDINREIEDKMRYGGGPTWHFPITSLNSIYTSAIDIFCQFVEDYEIKSKEDLLKYKDIYVKLYDNERGYAIETVTWEEWLRAEVLKECKSFYGNNCISPEESWKMFEDRDNLQAEIPEKLRETFKGLTKDMPSIEYFYLTDIDDLMVWNDLVHLFDIDHHHKSVLIDGSECEWYWTYTHDSEQREDGNFYRKEIGYKKIRVPVDARNKLGCVTTWIPDENIRKEIY